jgi:dihydrofolate reductase
MAQLIYSAIASLDGYVADARDNFDWAAPDEEVHAYINDLERPVGTYLYGRRLYEVMAYWETHPTDDGSEVTRDYARIWQAAEKIVYSRTLPAVSTARTRLERVFDPEVVRRMKVAAPHPISVGGAELGGEAIKRGLVDEVRLFLHPIIVGAGKRALPRDAHLNLELLDERRFRSGVVQLHYRVHFSGEPEE